MKTFVSAIFLMLAAFASAHSFESYEQHVASVEDGDWEMPLFELVDLDKGGDGGGKEKKSGGSDKKKKDNKKSSGGGKKSSNKKGSNKKSSNKKSSNKKSNRKSSRSNRKSSRSRRSSKSSSSSRSSRSSRSSSKSSKSSSSSSGSRSGGDFRRFPNRDEILDRNMCCVGSDAEQAVCRILWEQNCKPLRNPNIIQEAECEYIGIYDCIPKAENDFSNLRGNVVAE